MQTPTRTELRTEDLVDWRSLIDHPGRAGSWAAILDETARAADDYLRVLESFDTATYLAERPAHDPNARSPRAIAEHVDRAAWGYAFVIRQAAALPPVVRPHDASLRYIAPTGARAAIRDVLRLTEDTLATFEGLTYAQIRAMEFPVRWGPRYDPEMMLEHGICHFLRHRRQLERWRS